MPTYDAQTLLAAIEFSNTRLLAVLDVMETSGRADALAWRPGPARAHAAWQFVHCAATLDKYVNVYFLNRPPRDAQVIERFGGGSTPSDAAVPTFADIRARLATAHDDFKAAVARVDDFSRVITTGSKQRAIGEAVVLLTWHEAHHQGQVHLTWNLFKAAHGI